MASKKYNQAQAESHVYAVNSTKRCVGGSKKDLDFYGLDHLLAYLEHPETWGDRCFAWANPTERINYEQNGKRFFRQVKTVAYLAKYPNVVMQGKSLEVTCSNENCINPNHLKAVVKNLREGILSEAQKQRVKLKYSQGTSRAELASLFGCTVEYIARVIRN